MSVEPLSGGLVDNGTEFIANKLQLWLAELKIKPIYIIPASPWGSGFVELFHSSFRDECLNREQLWTLTEARVVIEDFRQDYNTERPHSSLGYLSPQRFIAGKSYQSQAPGCIAKPVRPSAWDCQPPPKSSHQPKPKTNTSLGPVFGTRSACLETR